MFICKEVDKHDDNRLTKRCGYTWTHKDILNKKKEKNNNGSLL